LLNVKSTPMTGIVITSSTGHGGTTNYTKSVPPGSSVTLTAPATDPAGYAFLYWKINSTVQPAGQKTVTFIMSAATTAMATYGAINLSVQSTPPTGVVIESSTGHGGTTNYTLQRLASGSTVTLTVPDADPAGYTFYQWKIAGVAQLVGQKTIGFTISKATTVLAVYRTNTPTTTLP
jgi:hypothetical protein